MLNDSKDVFIFELNESLYFNKGQEITEMIGISLDPEISIQPFNDYVSIRGVIELKGEYLKSSEKESNDDTFDFDDYQFRRYLENVEEINDSHAVFSHRFPVEISVPSYRVSNIENITVSIESFDYEIPNENELRLASSIEIQGINEKSLEKDETKEEKETEVFDVRPFEFEFIENPEDKENNVESLKELSAKNPILDSENDNKEKEIESESNEYELDEIDEDPERWQPQKSQTLPEFFEEKVIEEITDGSIETLEEKELYEETNFEEEFSNEEETSSNMEQVNDEEISTEESLHYLSDMFREEDEQEKYTQMRVCIVQQTDTIETIAERYEVSVLQLINTNRLEDDALTEGQLLTIPQKQKTN